MNGVNVLRPGDPCPCCGQPIRTDDPEKLWMLTCIALKMAFEKEQEAEA